MSDVTRILHAIEDGDSQAAEDLLPLVYGELRKLAAARMAQESSDHTLQSTALVHEAYIRLVGNGQSWDSRGHFFSAAAEAMRRILVDHARRKKNNKRGGQWSRIELPDLAGPESDADFDILALDDELQEFEKQHAEKFQVVKLRFFAGRTLDETAEIMGISRATAQRHWAYARAWLYGRLSHSGGD